MANSDKNIVITPNNGSANANPNIVFSGSFDPSQPATDPITLTVLPTTPGAINFSGSTGNLLLIRNNLDNTVYTQGNVTASYFIGNGSQLTGIGTASTANTAQTVTNNAQPNITSVGTLSSLSVSGNANIGNIGTGIITATGNITGSNLVTGVPGGVFTNTISAAGNANVGNIGATNGVFTNVSGNGSALTAITGANIIGTVPNATHAITANTVTNNAQPNITSVGTLTSLSVSGNITAGNINGGNLTQANYIVGTSEVRIGNVPGENWSRIQHLNTSNSYGFNSPLNQMLVITNEEATVKQALVLADATTSYSSPMFGVSVYEGNNSGPSTGNETWVPIFTVTGTGDISTAGTITSGGLSVTGNSNVGNIGTTGFITATGNIQGGNLITSGTLSAGGNANIGNIATGIISATGNVTAPFFIGNGSQLTGIVATTSQAVTNNAQPNITSVGTLTSLSVSGNTNSGNVNVTTAITRNNRNVPTYVAQPTAPADPMLGDQWYDTDSGVLYQYQNDGVSSYWQDMSTNVGTLSNLSVSGNITGDYFIGNGSQLTGITSNVAQTVTSNAQPNITSVGTLTSLSVSGNVTGLNFIGCLANGTTSICIPVANGNINFTVGGQTNEMVFTSTGANINGYITVDGNATITGVARRIISDFNNANIANRTYFQTASGNTTSIAAVPNGNLIGTEQTNFAVYNKANVANSGFAVMGIDANVMILGGGKTGTGTALPLILVTDDIERGRVATSGTFLWGKTINDVSSENGFLIEGDGRITSTIDDATATVNTNHVYNRNAVNNGYRFYVNSDGGVFNYSANDVNLSDERTKTDIQPATNYLQKICAIPVRTFKYKDQSDDNLNLGVIAQEVEAIAPELVSTNGFGNNLPYDEIPLKGIYTADMMFALMKAIQEQQEIINDLRDRIIALESANTPGES